MYKNQVDRCKLAKVIQVVEVHVVEGKGIKGDPTRLVVQYWSMDGKKLAEYDEWAQNNLELCEKQL